VRLEIANLEPTLSGVKQPTVGFSANFMSQKNQREGGQNPSQNKKDPELFENEALEATPSKRGRIISTVIVIVVAILVIWVFARNSSQDTSQNTTPKEEVKQAESAPAENQAEAANEATNPEDKLSQLQDDFTATVQATVDDINSAADSAANSFAEKKSDAEGRLADVSEAFKRAALLTVTQSLDSATKKIASLRKQTLQNVEQLKKTTLAKTKLEQLETAVNTATDKLNQSKETVLSAISTNGDKLTAATEQAINQALEKESAAQQKASAEATPVPEETATEEASTEEPATPSTETATPATEEQPAASTTDSGYEMTAQKGDSLTTLARKALQTAINNGQVSNDLSAEQKIYIEDYLQNQLGTGWVQIGETKTFSKDAVNAAVEKAKGLSESQLEHLKIYSSRVSF
jgi:hypothetical protein